MFRSRFLFSVVVILFSFIDSKGDNEALLVPIRIRHRLLVVTWYRIWRIRVRRWCWVYRRRTASTISKNRRVVMVLVEINMLDKPPILCKVIRVSGTQLLEIYSPLLASNLDCSSLLVSWAQYPKLWLFLLATIQGSNELRRGR